MDGQVAYIGGLCIGDDWLGDPAREIPPWRDTGVELRGPAVAEAELAFAGAWAAWGEGLPPAPCRRATDPRAEGNVSVRVVATSPDRTTLYRLELAALAAASDRIWLTDAYFMGTAVYIESLSAASRHGVDVRLLVPNNSDVRWVGNLSRTLYRRLLDAGVRIFEWNGPMIHAKTAVADRRFVRVGSTNLNLSSWMGNWELDVVIERRGLAAQMEEIYDRDLRNATEIVITDAQHRAAAVGAAATADTRDRLPRRRLARAASGSANRVIKDVALAGSALGSAVRGYRVLGPHEALSLVTMAGMLAVAGRRRSAFCGPGHSLPAGRRRRWWARSRCWPAPGGHDGGREDVTRQITETVGPRHASADPGRFPNRAGDKIVSRARTL